MTEAEIEIMERFVAEMFTETPSDGYYCFRSYIQTGSGPWRTIERGGWVDHGIWQSDDGIMVFDFRKGMR